MNRERIEERIKELEHDIKICERKSEEASKELEYYKREMEVWQYFKKEKESVLIELERELNSL